MRPLSTAAWPINERQQLEEGIIPSPNSVELVDTPFGAYLHRLTNRTPHVAELYHVNSKLTPSSTLQVSSDPQRLAEVRQWFFATAYRIREDEVVGAEAHRFRQSHDDLREVPPEVLAAFTAAGPATDLLYALDLLVLDAGRLVRVIPESRHLWVERELGSAELDRLRRSFLGPEAAAVAATRGALFVVGCPWRYMLLYGPRGYRLTLMDAGRLLAHLGAAAGEAGFEAAPAPHFYDDRVDRLLYADGVERSTLAALTLNGGPR